MRHWIMIVGCGVLAACSHAGAANTEAPPAASPQSISGTYVGGGHDPATDQVFIQALRLTQSAPGQFTGTLETNMLNQAGKDTASTQNVSGSYDGSHVTIVLDSGLGHTNRNATWTAGTITMTWMGDNGQLDTERFESKTDAQYAAILQAMGTARQQLVAEHNAAEQGAAEDKATGELVASLQRFLSKEATWTAAPLEKERSKALAFGDAGLTKINRLLAQHQGPSDAVAGEVDATLNQGQFSLGQTMDATDSTIASGRRRMAGLDQALATSPCLMPDDSLRPGARPSCAPLPALAQRYHAVHAQAIAMLDEGNRLTAQTRADYAAKVKEADSLTQSR